MIRFEYEIDSRDQNSVTLETEPGQRGGVEVEAGQVVLYVNRAGALFLAKVFLQLAFGRISSGFHVHLGENFDPEESGALRVVLEETELS